MAGPSNKRAKLELQDQPMEFPEQDIPPAQDSPKHILNILSDYCIQVILSKLDNILDFYNAAKVCTRFQMNAKSVCFPFKDILFDCEGLKWTDDNEEKYPIPTQCVEEFFSIFGQVIKSIDYVQRWDDPYFFGEYNWDESEEIVEMNIYDDVNLIQKYCRNNLVKLSIAAACYFFGYLDSKFESIEVLNLSSASIASGDLFPKLKILCLSGLDTTGMDWIGNEFPHLKKLFISGVNQLNDTIFIKFQTLNPQLEELTMYNPTCEFLTSLIWQDIGERLPNLVSLDVYPIKIDKNILDLCKLQKLRELSLDKFYWCNDSFKPLFDLFVDNNLLIEKLSINGIDIEAAMSLKKLKTIKDLTISRTSNEIIIDIVKELPALEQLKISCDQSFGRTPFVDEILQQSRKLTKFCVNGMEIEIDINE